MSGTVVGLRPPSLWVLRFRIPSGQEQEFSSRTGGKEPSFRLGDNTPVLYAADHRPELNSRFGLWFFPSLVALLGLVTLAFSLRGWLADEFFFEAIRSTCIIGVFGLTAMIVAETSEPGRAWPERAACVVDEDCGTFCDLGRCAPDIGRGFALSKFGNTCQQTEESARTDPANPCEEFFAERAAAER